MTALIDSNVLIASLVEFHASHADSIQLMKRSDRWATAAHALSELYNTLTKPRFYNWTPLRAAGAVTEFSRQLTVLSLDAVEHVHAIASFGASGGIGANVYDYLIGATARRHGLTHLVTWNCKHFERHFPDLTILTPTQYLETP